MNDPLPHQYDYWMPGEHATITVTRTMTRKERKEKARYQYAHYVGYALRRLCEKYNFCDKIAVRDTGEQWLINVDREGTITCYTDGFVRYKTTHKPGIGRMKFTITNSMGHPKEFKSSVKQNSFESWLSCRNPMLCARILKVFKQAILNEKAYNGNKVS